MSKMAERVARAIWGGEASTVAQWDVLSDDEKREWRLRAPAAIAAVLSCLPAHKASLTISHNLHKTYYEQIAKYLENGDLTISDAEKAKAIETDELWEMQWFPDTPVGSCRVGAASFGALIEAALQ